MLFRSHKLYDAISENIDSQLSGLIYVDPSYVKIKLKGTRLKNMRRISKKRGKHKTSRVFKNISGISHHKVCLMTAIDENDNMLFKIAGLGVERREILDQFKGFIEPKSTVVIDKKRDLETFVKDCVCKLDIVTVDAFRSVLGNTLATVNQLHQELDRLLILCKHGISTQIGRASCRERV